MIDPPPPGGFPGGAGAAGVQPPAGTPGGTNNIVPFQRQPPGAPGGGTPGGGFGNPVAGVGKLVGGAGAAAAEAAGAAAAGAAGVAAGAAAALGLGAVGGLAGLEKARKKLDPPKPGLPPGIQPPGVEVPKLPGPASNPVNRVNPPAPGSTNPQTTCELSGHCPPGTNPNPAPKNPWIGGTRAVYYRYTAKVTTLYTNGGITNEQVGGYIWGPIVGSRTARTSEDPLSPQYTLYVTGYGGGSIASGNPVEQGVVSYTPVDRTLDAHNQPLIIFQTKVGGLTFTPVRETDGQDPPTTPTSAPGRGAPTAEPPPLFRPRPAPPYYPNNDPNRFGAPAPTPTPINPLSPFGSPGTPAPGAPPDGTPAPGAPPDRERPASPARPGAPPYLQPAIPASAAAAAGALIPAGMPANKPNPGATPGAGDPAPGAGTGGTTPPGGKDPGTKGPCSGNACGQAALDSISDLVAALFGAGVNIGTEAISTKALMAKLESMDEKLGPKIADDTMAGRLNKLWEFGQDTYNFLQVDRVLNILTWISVIHNSFMLSNGVLQTVFGTINNVLNVFHIEKLTKDGKKEPYNVQEEVNKWTEQFFVNMFGKSTVQEIEKDFKRFNRIYQAASNLLFSVQSIAFSVVNAVQIVGDYVALIGNALKKFGVVGELAYKWMNPALDLSKGAKIYDVINNVQHAVSVLDTISAEVLNIEQASKQIGDQTSELVTAVTGGETAVAQTAIKAKTDSLGVPIPPSSEQKPGG